MPAKVSVCIPVFNGERFIGEAVLSAASQSYPDLEIVVVDNQSTDETWSILQRLEQSVDRLRLHRNAETVSMYENFNKTLDWAEGQYIKFLCADDVLYERCVEQMVDVLERDAEVGLVTCRDHRIDEAGVTLRSTHPFSQDRRLPGERVVRRMIREVSGTYTKTPTHVMYRSRSREADKFPLINDNGWGNDTYKWMEILQASAYAFLDADLIGNREHSRSYSASEARVDHRTILQGYYNFFARFMTDYPAAVGRVDRFLFKRTLKRRLRDHGLTIGDLDDWAGLF